MRPPPSAVRLNQDSSHQQILAAQVRLLYASAPLGAGASALAAALLGALLWKILPTPVVVGWCLYMILASAIRFAFARAYHRAPPNPAEIGRWRTALTLSVALTGIGWGAAGILLYPPTQVLGQVFVIFVIGGMMLGASSMLAPRPEAFLAFLLPAGIAPSIGLFVQGDEVHLAMGLLALVFTIAVIITTGHIHRTVDTSLRLRIENQDLVKHLQAANQATAALNQSLELRVQERTAELHDSAELLRAEIIHRQEAEEELLRARKLESLGVLAGGIAHDFNNFLTVVQGNIDVARSRLDPVDPASEFLAQATSACERAALLSTQLLTFAKGGAPIRRIVSIGQLLTEAVQLANTGSATRITVSIAEDLWSAQLDPGQFSQVIHNILLNARQSMPGGGLIEIRAENVTAHPDESDARIRISIRDYGCGIPIELLERIFDPYFTTKPGGNGLGLATAYAIIRKHGGYISVESTLGAGTTFIIELPASRQAPLQHAPVPHQAHRGTERLLVMDDEEDLRILMKAVLTNFGYSVETARDGAEAIALYQAARTIGSGFDAVLLDLTIVGGIGGVEAAASLKQIDPSAKLIVSSGYSDAPVMSSFRQYGFDAIILKPWRVTEMTEVLRNVLLGDAAARAPETLSADQVSPAG